jgi:hypothetical protein
VVRKRGAQATSTQGVWDGATPPPPPEALTARQCPPIAFMCLWRRCAHLDSVDIRIMTLSNRRRGEATQG